MNESLTISFNAESSVTGSISDSTEIWARIEQEYKTELEREATISDVRSMLSLAERGISPYSYISDECPYIIADGDIIIISLDFYVWPSSLDLEYELTTEFGTISDGVIDNENVEFDLIFNGTSQEQMDYIFEGKFTSQMPIIKPDGDKILLMPLVPENATLNTPHMKVYDTYVWLSEEVYTVFRAKGQSKGYQHTITMTLTKEDGYSIENLTNSIVLTYEDEDGDLQEEVLDLEIPNCVKDLLAKCPNDVDDEILKYALVIDSNNSNKIYAVYVNSCDGSIIKERWENKPGLKTT